MTKYVNQPIYHVYNRGAHKARIFADNDDYRRLLGLLEKYAKKYTVTVVAYCLMPNHYHLVLRQGFQGSISGFLKTTFNAYTQAINTLRNHSGTLFQGNAKGIPVDTDEYAMQLIRYIHLNPVMAKLVSHPEKWEFSDYREWIDLRKGSLFDPAFRLGYFPTGEDYKEFVKNYQEETDRATISQYLLN